MNESEKTAYEKYRKAEFFKRLMYYVNNGEIWGTKEKSAHLTYWRRILFFFQSLLNRQDMEEMLDFCQKSPAMFRIIEKHSCILELITRQWMYYKATMQERIKAMEYHFEYLQNKMPEKIFEKLYLGNGLTIWESPAEFKEKLSIRLQYGRDYRKEGFWAMNLFTENNHRLYSAAFWINEDENGDIALWLGCLQGSKGNNKLIKQVTKQLFGYRPKNLMIYMLRLLAQHIGAKKIYAVSDYGSYVNHRFSSKRRLKMSLDNFWLELGGTCCADKRFFELPMMEYRKPIADVVSHKRNQYRKRYAVMDEIQQSSGQIMSVKFAGSEIKS